jgi:hypothetical protein
MRVGVSQGGLISPVHLCLMSTTCPHPRTTSSWPYTWTTIIANSRKSTLLVSYLESYLNDLQRWLSEWRIATNVNMSTAIMFACAGRLFIKPRPLTLRGMNRMGRHFSLSGGDPRYTTHLVASHRPGQEDHCSKDGYAGSPPEVEVTHRSGMESYISRSLGPRWTRRALPGDELPPPCPEVTGDKIQVSSPRYRCPLLRK